MSKFKVGDKVKVVNGGWGIAYEDVEKMRGEVFEVFSYLSDGYFGEEGYLLKPSLLKRFEYMPGEDGFIGEGSLELVEAAQESNETPPLVQKTTPKNDDSGEGVSQPRVDKNAWFERGELPPVGVLCEMQDDLGVWAKVEIFSHHKGFCHGWAGAECSFYSDDPKEFRPIKTAEEIEAEEREKVIEEMARVISSKVSDKRAAESLYELGYRKVGE